ncbi:MAG TPA: exosortase K [Thermoanaerobaculia bacterium]|jgi:exosortase K|nr:exosortase K [Thermoanaerobaculia bacterium]
MNGNGDGGVRRLPWISWVAGLAAAYGLKLGYSRASVEDLGWILAPTAKLVGALRGEVLGVTAAGWAPPDGSYVIAPACAGVNFLILAFVVSVLGFSHRFRTSRGRFLFWLGALGGAWTITLGVNTVRILAAVELYRRGSILRFTPEQLHRLLGVAVYLSALWGVFAALDRLTKRERTGRGSAGAFLLVPGTYLGMTLGVPLLTGSFREGGGRFAEHAIMVLGATLAALGVALVGWRWVDRIEGRP